MLIARSWCEGQLAHPAGMSCSLIVNSKGMNGINNFWNWTCPSDWTNGKPPTQLVLLWNESSCNMEAASANRKSIRVNMKAVVFLKQNCTEDICREEPGSKDECIELQIFIALIIKVTIFFLYFGNNSLHLHGNYAQHCTLPCRTQSHKTKGN